MPAPEISPEIIRLIDEMEVFVRAAAQLSQHPAPEDIIKKNLRLLNVVMTGADKDFIGIPETEALEFARQTMEEEQKPLELV